MSSKGKLQVLYPGGITLVTTPSMAYMAKAAFKGLKQYLKKKSVDYCEITFEKFSHGEVLPVIGGNVRMKHVYLFYDFNGDMAHDSFVLMLTLSALEDAGAEKITVVAPFFPWMRQDRKDRPRVPISAKVFIRQMTEFDAVKNIITMDMHSEQMQAVSLCALDHLPGFVVFEPWIRKHFGNQLSDVVVVGPDFGSEKRVDRLAVRLGCGRAYLTKKRDKKKIEIREIHGDAVEGKICIVNDDILDTCGTMEGAAIALRRARAREVILTGTHPVFGGEAYERLAASGCRVVVTDSRKTEPHPWLEVVPLAPYLTHAILQNNIVDGSVSKIINDGLPQ